MKQARAFGVGVVIATQNPMDLDYRALSNAGLWCIGRLQTDADRERVMEGLSGATTNGAPSTELDDIVKQLAPRWFVVRNAHVAEAGPVLLRPRNTWSVMRGPLTRMGNPKVARNSGQRERMRRTRPEGTTGLKRLACAWPSGLPQNDVAKASVVQYLVPEVAQGRIMSGSFGFSS